MFYGCRLNDYDAMMRIFMRVSHLLFAFFCVFHRSFRLSIGGRAAMGRLWRSVFDTGSLAIVMREKLGTAW